MGGYYTYFTLEIEPSPTEEMLNAIFQESSDFRDMFYGDAESMKWYDHDEEMLELSLKYPKYVFILDGDGDEKCDVWRSFYKNGKMYTWTLPVEVPDFDETKLQ